MSIISISATKKLVDDDTQDEDQAERALSELSSIQPLLSPMIIEAYCKTITRSQQWDERFRPKDPLELLITTPEEYINVLQQRAFLNAAVKAANAKAIHETKKGYERASKSQKVTLFKKKSK
jgi:hypothetical protein